jgi:hypothetical protein
LIAFEKLSRYILAPVTAQNNLQTCWFFERARGQYKTLRGREGFTKSRQSAFDRKYPKSQELIQKMVDWDRRKRVLEDWKWKVMDDVLQRRKPLDDRKKYTFFLNLEKLKKHGFTEG